MDIIERKKKLMEEAKVEGYIGVGLISIFEENLTEEDIREYREMLHGMNYLDDKTIGNMLRMTVT